VAGIRLPSPAACPCSGQARWRPHRRPARAGPWRRQRRRAAPEEL